MTIYIRIWIPLTLANYASVVLEFEISMKANKFISIDSISIGKHTIAFYKSILGNVRKIFAQSNWIVTKVINFIES